MGKLYYVDARITFGDFSLLAQLFSATSGIFITVAAFAPAPFRPVAAHFTFNFLVLAPSRGGKKLNIAINIHDIKRIYSLSALSCWSMSLVRSIERTCIRLIQLRLMWINCHCRLRICARGHWKINAILFFSSAAIFKELIFNRAFQAERQWRRILIIFHSIRRYYYTKVLSQNRACHHR